RLPRMSHYIFRGYPARARVYYAEHLQKEGWYFKEGWTLKKFFATEAEEEGFDPDILVAERRFDSAAEWRKAHEAYEQYGKENGLLLSEALRQRLKTEGQGGGPKAHDAGEKLKWSDHYRVLTNFDAFFNQSFTEKQEDTVLARRALSTARKRVF